MNMQKPPIGKHEQRFCNTCHAVTKQEVHFDEHELKHLICYECGTVTHLHPHEAGR